ncbi:hypothetical protein VTK73DRAFT_2409 [Phialemonium thermophilum]|uniref:chitinase n=1 Tax=Phialemonium thermophilum TaxID=223376 RepID=A0ABR3X566_9PEZI
MFFLHALAASASLMATLSSALPAKRQTSDGKLVVYWGAEDDSTTLDDVCSDPSYDIVNLAFLDTFFAAGGYPQMSISGLWSSTQAQKNAGATGLKDGSSIVPAIQKCQAAGKPVLLSLGGYNADVTLANDDQGRQIANTLWNLFLGGTQNRSLRPFGDLKLDGFDLDNESHNPTGYLVMVQQMRANFQNDTSKRYLLTAAPQCPYPDASMPLNVCREMDYVWVQFYNNGNCNVAQPGFLNAVRKWSSGIGNAKLFIGALASGADGDQGYVDANTLENSLRSVQSLNLPNYGGAMLWEAQLAVQNGNYQKKIATAV